MMLIMAKAYESIEGCPVAMTMELIGDRWTALVLRDLILKGPQRFRDFELSLSGVTPTVLSNRLKDLETNGLVIRTLYNERPPRLEYQLTKRGESLGPVIAAMRTWGLKDAKLG